MWTSKSRQGASGSKTGSKWTKTPPAAKGSEHSAVDALSEEELAELKETFNLFDRDNHGQLRPKELGEAMRAMAQHPTEREIQDLVKKPEVEGEETVHTGLTDFTDFLNIMAKRMTVPEPDDQLLEAFKVFDKDDTGMISSADLRQVLTTLGERLTDEEADELIREADDDGDGQINYTEFSHVLVEN